MDTMLSNSQLDVILASDISDARSLGCKIQMPEDGEHHPQDWDDYIGIVPNKVRKLYNFRRVVTTLVYTTRRFKYNKRQLRNGRKVCLPPPVYNDRCRSYGAYYEVHAYVKKLGLKTQYEWLAFTRLRYASGPNRGERIKPDWIPTAPDVVYKGKGWTSWGNFLGTHGRLLPWKDFMHWISNTPEILTRADYRAWYKNHPEMDFLPYRPEQFYDEWTSWHHVLKDRRNYRHPDFYKHQYPDYDTFITLMNTYKITSLHKYVYWRSNEIERKEKFPPNPPMWYGSKWKGWPYVFQVTHRDNSQVGPTCGVVHTDLQRELNVLYRPKGYPSGVFFAKSLTGTVFLLKQSIELDLDEILGMWEGSPTLFHTIVDDMTSEWLGDVSGSRITFNKYELLSRLDMEMKKVG